MVDGAKLDSVYSVEPKRPTETGWLCKVRIRNWQLMKKFAMFGVSDHGKRSLREARTNELLVVYIGKPVFGVVGICRFSSRSFRDESPIWAQGYPWRARIEVLRDFSRNPLAYPSLTHLDSEPEMEVTPYFLGMGLIRLSDRLVSRVLRVVETSSTQ